MSITYSKTGQAMPEKTVKLDTSAFDTISGTEVYWLGNSSLLINSRGTIILIDPILDSFDMPLLIDMPIASRDIPRVDALLISHIDNDHLAFDTLENIKGQTKSFHAPAYVADVMKEKGFDTQEHTLVKFLRSMGLKLNRRQPSTIGKVRKKNIISVSGKKKSTLVTGLRPWMAQFGYQVIHVSCLSIWKWTILI